MRVSYHPGYYAQISEDHVFPMRKFEGLHRYLLEKSVIRPKDVISPRQIDYQHLYLVHTRRYVSAIAQGTLERKEARRLGLPWSESLAVRSRLAVQGTLNASLMALQDGIAGNLAGGTHHAYPDHGEGFCVYNDVCVAVRALKWSKWAGKILIVDCDVHQGNGTASVFQDDPDVFTFSMHGENNYPFRKPDSDRDVPLEDGMTDKPYLHILERELNSILDQFEPDIVFYLGGIDPLESDKYGRLRLTIDGIRQREELVIRKFTEMQLPLVLLISGGGYGPAIDETVEAHAQLYEVAAGLGY